MATTGARRCGGRLRAKTKAEAKRKWSAGRLGRTLAGLRPRPGAAWPTRTERWRRVAVAGDTRRAKPETGRPLNVAIQFVSDPMLCLTASLHGELSAKPKLQRASDLHDLCSPMYQLQLWFKYLVLIRNRNGVISCSTSAVSRLVDQPLRKFAKCGKLDFSGFCGTHSSMLEAKSVHDPKIKVVPYVKHYNFALVNSSMQGL